MERVMVMLTTNLRNGGREGDGDSDANHKPEGVPMTPYALKHSSSFAESTMSSSHANGCSVEGPPLIDWYSISTASRGQVCGESDTGGLHFKSSRPIRAPIC